MEEGRKGGREEGSESRGVARRVPRLPGCTAGVFPRLSLHSSALAGRATHTDPLH